LFPQGGERRRKRGKKAPGPWEGGGEIDLARRDPKKGAPGFS